MKLLVSRASNTWKRFQSRLERRRIFAPSRHKELSLQSNPRGPATRLHVLVAAKIWRTVLDLRPFGMAKKNMFVFFCLNMTLNKELLLMAEIPNNHLGWC